MNKQNAKLERWQAKVNADKVKLKLNREAIDEREQQYKGEQYLTPVTAAQEKAWGSQRKKALHVFNVIAENIESEIDVNIPQPKVTAVRKEDEPLAKIIEDFIRSEMDRINFEEMNDMQERTVPVQGGSFWMVGWDNAKRTHTTVGEVYVNMQHPKRVIPQHGVFSSIADMEHIAIEVPKTKEEIKRRYGVDVSNESEDEPDIKSSDNDDAPTDMVTQTIIFYKNNEGGIGRYSYVGDNVLEDFENWNARQRRRCSKCGASEEDAATPMEQPTIRGEYPGASDMYSDIPDDGTFATAPHRPKEKGVCPYCGSKSWEIMSDGYRTLNSDYITKGLNKILPAFTKTTDEFGNAYVGEQVLYPYYVPDIYPIVLQRNISVYGELLGESDVDKISDQQNLMNHISNKINDRMFKSGTKISLPSDVEINSETEDGEVIRLEDPSQAAMIKTFDFTGDLSPQLAYRATVYEEPRQILGITDSLQGRKDTTATSAIAKEFSAQQSAGRLESKRRLKNAAYARIFELIFKTALANMDEPRPVRSRENGKIVYGVFDPMDFYEMDDAGQWYVNDRFLFSTDSAAPLASNREAMWREISLQFDKGAYGDPTQDETRMLYWELMEELHYPLAAAAKKAIKERVDRQSDMIKKQIAMLANAGSDGMPPQDAEGIPPVKGEMML